MEWFSQRGEAYEANCDLIERRLGALAKDSAPFPRAPYDGRVRVTARAPRGARGAGAGAAGGVEQAAELFASSSLGGGGGGES